MARLLRKMVIMLAALSPFTCLRKRIYNLIPNYDIHQTVSIGFFTIIDVESFSIESDSRIGKFNTFSGPINVAVGEKTSIGSGNTFHAGDWVVEDRFLGEKYARSFTVGSNCLITSKHFFDIAGKITIGDEAWVAGRRSEFWTHGVSATDRDISIGRFSYVGSGVKFSPGASIGELNVVALGSVVATKIDAHASIIAGMPAKPVKSIYSPKLSGWPFTLPVFGKIHVDA